MNTVKFNDKVKQFKPSKKIKASPSTHDFRKVNANNLIKGSIRFYKLFKHQICVIEGMKKIIN